jgi:uncharacterized OsmC-like protein
MHALLSWMMQDSRVFPHIHMHFVVKGRTLAAEKVERAIRLSAEKILLGIGDAR